MTQIRGWRNFLILVMGIMLMPKACSANSRNITLAAYRNSGHIYFIGTHGADTASGRSAADPFGTIQQALKMANPGDTIVLLAGTYFQDAYSVRAGQAKLPIRIVGMPGAIVKGAGKGRIFEIRHSYIELLSFTIDGLIANGSRPGDYRDKLVYIKGQRNAGIRGVRLLGMDLRNAAGECVRVKYQAQDNEIAYSRIHHCGAKDFLFGRGGHNGEAIYIGTAPEQVAEGYNPTDDVDHSDRNWIHHNTIKPYGSECVDIKEGSRFNRVEYNTCSQEKDPNVGGISIRGNENIVRFNTIFMNQGAGIRLGGDTERDGIENDVFGNYLDNNKGGGLKIMRLPQHLVCDNTILTVGDQKAVRTAVKMDTGVFLESCEASR